MLAELKYNVLYYQKKEVITIMNTIRVLVADDNIEFGEIVCDYLTSIEDIEAVGKLWMLETIRFIDELRPDIVIMTLSCHIWMDWQF